MGSKRFRGKLCVYCSERVSVTGDHVFAREFFVHAARDQLPQVPSCEGCNNEKSKLEHYLTAVLPFGGRHTDANETLTLLVPGRLAKNANLRRELQLNQGRTWHCESNVIHYAMTVPVDAARVNALFALIARALAWLHFGAHLSSGHASEAIFLSRYGEEYFGRLFAHNAANRARADLGRERCAMKGRRPSTYRN
jgi:hypothetical protein